MWQQNPMMFNNGYNPQSYGGYNQPTTQTIQQITQNTQKQASCYFVKTPEELAGVNIMPNIFYLGINRDNKEIYMRRMNNDGNIEVEKYTLSSGVKEKSEMQTIIDWLKSIESKIAEIQQKGVTSNERDIKPVNE